MLHAGLAKPFINDRRASSDWHFLATTEIEKFWPKTEEKYKITIKKYVLKPL